MTGSEYDNKIRMFRAQECRVSVMNSLEVLSNSLETTFCLQALERALQTAKPGIFNTDQGAQFTSEEFTGRLITGGNPDQHGRSWAPFGQYLRGTALAFGQSTRRFIFATMPTGRTLGKVLADIFGFTIPNGGIKGWNGERRRMFISAETERNRRRCARLPLPQGGGIDNPKRRHYDT